MAFTAQDFPPLPNSSILGPSPAGLSYAENVSASSSKPADFPVSFFAPSRKLTFNASDLKEGNSLWTSALIGYSLGPRPYYERLLKAMQKLWHLKGTMNLLSLADGFFLLKFSTSEDLEMVLTGGPWFLLGKPFILQRWSPKFKPKRDESSPIPIWIKIVDFPLALWTPTGISRIASYIGCPPPASLKPVLSFHLYRREEGQQSHSLVLSLSHCREEKKNPSFSAMEASMRSKLITAVLVAIVAASSLVEQAAAADAPAPSPTSGAVTTSPALVFSSLSALLVGYLFC